FSSSGFQSKIQVEPMCERRVSTAAPAGVFAIIGKLRPKKKAAGGPPHECDGQSAALLDAQALRWTRLQTVGSRSVSIYEQVMCQVCRVAFPLLRTTRDIPAAAPLRKLWLHNLPKCCPYRSLIVQRTNHVVQRTNHALVRPSSSAAR